jgi:Skp family chaperone for outer membrane proteins
MPYPGVGSLLCPLPPPFDEATFVNYKNRFVRGLTLAGLALLLPACADYGGGYGHPSSGGYGGYGGGSYGRPGYGYPGDYGYRRDYPGYPGSGGYYHEDRPSRGHELKEIHRDIKEERKDYQKDLHHLDKREAQEIGRMQKKLDNDERSWLEKLEKRNASPAEIREAQRYFDQRRAQEQRQIRQEYQGREQYRRQDHAEEMQDLQREKRHAEGYSGGHKHKHKKKKDDD